MPIGRSLAWAILLLSLPCPARSQEGEVLVSASPAFDGWVRQDGWTAAAVTVENHGRPWKGHVAVAQDNSRLESELELPQESRKRVWVPVQAQQRSGPERFVDLEPASGQALSARIQLRPLSQNDALIGALSDESVSLGMLARVGSPRGPGSVYVAPVAAADLPAHPRGYEALDALFTARWQPSSLAPEQVGALKGWVASGGLLVVSAEQDLGRLRADWLKDLLPGRVVGDSRADVLRALQRHTGAPSDPRDKPWSARLEPAAGARALLAGEDGPLALTRPYGQGAVVLLGFNIADPAIGAYDGWPAFALDLLGLHPPAAPHADVRKTGASLLAQSLERMLKKAALPRSNPAGAYALFALIYLMVLVPGNYVYFARRDRRDGLWLGMLAVILSFTGLAWGIGAWGRGPAASSELWVVEAGPGAGTGRVLGWTGLFSPARRSRALPLPAEMDSAEELFSNPGVQAAYYRLASNTQGPRPFRLERSARASLLHIDSEVGQLRFFHFEGERPLGDGLALDWTPGGAPRLHWRNRTGISFRKIFLLRGPWLMASGSGLPAANSAEGTIPVSETPIPLLAALGEDFGSEDAEFLSRYFSQHHERRPVVVGLPEKGPPGAKEQEARTVFLWTVAEPSDAPPPAGRYFLDLRSSRGYWNAFNDSVNLNSGQLAMALPAPQLAGSVGGDAVVRLEGTWPSEPLVEAFDFRSGRWVQPAGQAPAEGEDDLELPLGAQAALAVASAGLARAAIVTAGEVLILQRVRSPAPRRVRVDIGVDSSAPPAIAIDGRHRTHLVYLKGGRLWHAVEEGGRVIRKRALPGTNGARGPSLAASGGELALSYVLPGRGAFCGSYAKGAWDVVQVGTDDFAPVSAVALLAGGTGAAFARDRELALFTRASGGRWEKDATPGAQVGAPPSFLSLGGTLESPHVLALSPAFGGQLVHFYRLPRMRYWTRNYQYLGTGRMAATPGEAMGSGAFSEAHGGLWMSYVRAGQLWLQPPMGGGTPVLSRTELRPPFAFAADVLGTGYWILRSSDVLKLYRRPGALRMAPAMGVGMRAGARAAQELVRRFTGASRLLWEEAGMARIRVTATGSTSIIATEVLRAP